MGRRCSVCDHPQRALIEAAVASGTGSKRRISARFNVSEQALRRHVGSHIEVSSRFVGRTRELAEIEAGLREAAAGRGRVYLVVGEPGIGKSTLLEEVATRAGARGFDVAWGRCWEAGGAPALWPWTQVVRATAKLDARPRAGIDPLVPSADEGSRFQQFSSVVEKLRAVSSDRPLAVLLDDVHAADKASLLLLAFAAGELRDASVLIVATYRDVEARRSPDLAKALADVARWSKRLPLEGLDAREVAQLVASVAGAPQSDDLVRRIHAVTGGNPFFVDEVVRLHLAKTPDVDAVSIPEGVRDAIRATLAPLDAASRELLDTASVVGRRFEPEIVAAVSDVDADDIGDALRATGVVVDSGAGQHAFSHAIVRETVYDDLRPGTRVQLHRRVGEVLESRPDAASRSSELAFHFFNAAPAGGAEKAVEYAKRAGDHAMDVLAYEDAAAEYDRALKALGLCEPDDVRRCDLLSDLGQALTRAGELTQANRNLRAAADTARRAGDARRFASAVRDMSSEAAFGVADVTETRLIEEALDALGAEDSDTRASLLGRLGRLIAPRDATRSAALSADAVAMARRVGDANTLATTLIYALSAYWGPDEVDQRLAIAAEIVDVAQRAVDRFLGLGALTAIHIDRANRDAADDALREATAIADRLMQPRYAWQTKVLRACLALVDGRHADADAIALEALAVGQSAHETNAELAYGAHAAVSHHDRGLLPDLETALMDVAARYPSPTWPAVLAVLHASAGRPERARRELDRIVPRELPKDVNWLLTNVMAAEATSRIGDADLARELYELLSPYTGRIAMVASAAAYGPIARYLGLLAATCGDADGADEHFRVALEICRQMRAPAWEAHVLRDHGRALLDTDPRRAAALLAEAADLYRSLGLESQAHETTKELDATGRAVSAVAARPERATLQRDGSSWRVVFEGAEFRVRDSHGMRYVAYLLARPGLESHVLDLVSALRGGGEAAVPSADAGDALDPAARAAYRARIEELRAEVSDADERGDTDGATRAQQEIDAIAHELASAMGLGGRSRRVASEAEHARLNVTRAIRTAIRAIDALSPSLGRYLQTTIRTGTFCSYEPDPRFPVHWDV